MMQAKVTITVDDFAFSAGVDEAVCALAQQGVIHASTALVLSPRWAQSAPLLRACAIDKGLHLDFTTDWAMEAGFGLALPKVIQKSYLRQWSNARLLVTIGEQLDRYAQAMGQVPDFIDGHQHVHQLPQIRLALFDALAMRSMRPRYIRSTASPVWRGRKAKIIELLGGRALAALCSESHIPYNDDFAGVYGFSPAEDLAALWQSWLSPLEPALDGGPSQKIIMCHPASPGKRVPRDEIALAREREYVWLSSPAFAAVQNATQ